MIKTECTELPESNIANVQDSNNYLGIHQEDRHRDLHRVRQVLRNQLKGQKKSRAINTSTLAVIRYPSGIVTWPKKERGHSYKTRKVVTMHGGFYEDSRISAH